MYCVYILYSKSADKYYVGSTSNIEQRLYQHNNSTVNKFTSKYRPWELMSFFEVGDSKRVALQIEKHIKKQKSRKYVEDIVTRGSIDALIKKFTD
ncbi:GIY-YIG nuclease family protein [Saccharicrinis sp. FJH62]|uniref:GIY-YIG nuclease family protein n=1 Tax=Saccharicrinis sp. FJH62 TaxID=3344657 RepID=UPI0035D5142B